MMSEGAFGTLRIVAEIASRIPRPHPCERTEDAGKSEPARRTALPGKSARRTPHLNVCPSLSLIWTRRRNTCIVRTIQPNQMNHKNLNLSYIYNNLFMCRNQFNFIFPAHNGIDASPDPQ